MINNSALNKAIKDYWERKSDIENDAYDSGCHGIIGVSSEEGLLKSFLIDYLEYASEKGKDKKPIKSRPLTPKGTYINSPEWN